MHPFWERSLLHPHFCVPPLLFLHLIIVKGGFECQVPELALANAYTHRGHWQLFPL
jgi:hypothetical protein